MEKRNGVAYPIMVVGNDPLTYTIVCNLLMEDYPVLFFTPDEEAARKFIIREVKSVKKLKLLTDWPDAISSKLVVLIGRDSLEIKDAQVREVEKRSSEYTVIAVNLESVFLEEIHVGKQRASRIFGLNWCYPVHRTFFAEIITNSTSDPYALDQLTEWLRQYWGKHPSVAKAGFSVRARMMAAMLREGLYLVENNFASVASVDRACRNDAGYYLPFVGNFRYMDLMGTYAYGMVMKDLNKELSNANHLPKILQDKKYKGETGMDTGRGFYTYSPEEKSYWRSVFEEFSQEIQQLISKYPHETADH